MSLAHWVYSKVILLPNNTVNPCGSMGRNILPLLTDSSSTEQWRNDVPANAHRDSLALNAGRLVMVRKAHAANNPGASTLSSFLHFPSARHSHILLSNYPETGHTS